MANTTNKKFGVVHGVPSQLSSATIEEGKLYFLAGEADGAIKQGIYGVDGVTADANGNVTDYNYNLAMFGCGSVADGNGYGLSQYNYDSDASTKLKNLHDASSNYLLKTSYVQVSKSFDGYVPKADGAAGTIDSQNDDWVLTFNGSSVDWHKLPANAFKNDNSIYTGTAPINVNGTTISHANSGVAAGRYGDTSSARTLEFGSKFNVIDVSVNEFGHVTNVISRELTLPEKPETAGTADEANKTTGTLTIKVNGTPASSFNGSADRSLNFKNGTNISISEETDGVINISTSGVPTTTEMNTAINTALSSALQYKGTVNDTSALPTTGNKIGDVYVCSTLSSGKKYYETKQNDVSVRCESGDLFIWNGTYFDIVNGENQVSNENATLSIGGSQTIATVDGTDIVVSLPSSGYYTHPASTSGTTSADSSLKSSTATLLPHEGTFTVATGVYRDASGHISKVATETFALPKQYVHPVAGTGTVDTPTNSSTAATLLTRVKIDASGHVTDTTAFNGTVGGTTTPIYFNAGVPTALGYTIATSVPSDALFTDKNVQDASGTGKSFILGHEKQGTTATATTNVSVYMQSGKMYATSGSVASNDTALVTGGTVYTAIEAVKDAATIYWETL